MTTDLTDRKAKWRLRHPKRNRERRKLDDENQRVKRKLNKSEGKPSETPLTCSKTGCNKPGQVHHAGNKRQVLCRQHHQIPHNKRGDGPGSNGPGRNGTNESSHAGGLVHHPSHELLGCKNPVKGIKHTNEPPVDLAPNGRGGYGVQTGANGALLQNLTRKRG